MPELKPIEEKKKKEDRFEVDVVATQTAPVIKDTETGDVYNEVTILCKIANDINKLKKLL
ncbi:MAG: hypothetical protein JSW08_01990 [archaeon]|nr:MAG: hypothetical protein JSW08_01990 [archaeon]